MNFLILGKIMEIFRTHACGPAWIFLDRQYYWYKGESKKKKKKIYSPNAHVGQPLEQSYI